jgi:EmrB/QacA subfamily drug resistance transporter
VVVATVSLPGGLDASRSTLDSRLVQIAYGTPAGKWVLAATVGGSSVAFLDATVVNVALPSIASDLGTDLSGLQWTLDAYLVTLTGLLLFGGSLGDRYGRRRVYLCGLGGFTAASLLCGLAPSVTALVVARALQGVGAALLVPGSLAILSSTFRPQDRARAVGAWSGLAALAGAVGPFLGGWLVQSASWRLVFLVNLPVALATAAIVVRHVPESRDPQATGRPDLPGALAASLGLAGCAYALIEAPGGLRPGVALAVAIGLGGIVAFVVVEARRADPMLPLEIFRSRQFDGANATTLAVYFGLGGAIFLLVLQLQTVLGYSPVEAGASLLPVTVLMLLLSSRAGGLAQRVGPRLPMTVGPLMVAAGLLLFRRVEPEASYLGTVLPAAVVFGSGLVLTVAPLTSTVLAAVEERHLGVASGVNNAVARLGGLLAVALLPAVAGIDPGGASLSDFTAGFARAMAIAAGACVAGAVIALATIDRSTAVPPISQAGVDQPCHHPCVTERAVA